MFPRWVSILFLLFLSYMLYVDHRPRPVAPPAPAAVVEKAVAGATPPDDSALRDLFDGTRWRRAINPTYQPPLKPCAMPERPKDQLASYAIVTESGAGVASHCGEEAHFAITRWDRHGKAGATHHATLTLGGQPGLDALLVGMRPQETRLLFLHVPATGYATLPGWEKNSYLAVTMHQEGPAALPVTPLGAKMWISNKFNHM